MFRKIHLLTLVFIGLSLSACAFAPPIPTESRDSDAFVLQQDLAGKSTGKGVFKTITGVKRGFTAKLDGIMDGDTFVLVEDFIYDDGETDRKTWRFTPVSDGRFVGTREDVVGTADGFRDENAFRLEYLVDLPRANGSSTRVRFKDVLVKNADGSITNNANVIYYGLRIGRVSLTITPDP